MPRSSIHPGSILADELETIGMTAAALAREIDVPPNRVSQIIQGKRAITGVAARPLVPHVSAVLAQSAKPV